MGISGLLPFLKNASRPVNIKELKAGREQSFVIFAKLCVSGNASIPIISTFFRDIIY